MQHTNPQFGIKIVVRRRQFEQFRRLNICDPDLSADVVSSFERCLIAPTAERNAKKHQVHDAAEQISTRARGETADFADRCSTTILLAHLINAKCV